MPPILTARLLDDDEESPRHRVRRERRASREGDRGDPDVAGRRVSPAPTTAPARSSRHDRSASLRRQGAKHEASGLNDHPDSGIDEASCRIRSLLLLGRGNASLVTFTKFVIQTRSFNFADEIRNAGLAPS